MTDEHTPPPAPEPAPAYAAPAPAAHSNEGQGLGIASLVLGILGVLTAWIPIVGFVAWIFAPLGLIFGFISVGKPAAKGLAIGGLITSGIALAICIAWVVGFGALVNQAQKDGLLENMPTSSSSAEISTDGDTTTITTPDSTTTVTSTPNDSTAPSDDAASGHDQTPAPPSN